MYTTDLTGVKLTLKEFKNEAMESTISSLSTIDTLFQMVSEAPVRLVYNAQSERLRASNDQGLELYEQSLEFMRTHSCRGFRFPTTLDPEQVTFGKLCSLVAHYDSCQADACKDGIELFNPADLGLANILGSYYKRK